MGHLSYCFFNSINNSKSITGEKVLEEPVGLIDEYGDLAYYWAYLFLGPFLFICALLIMIFMVLTIIILLIDLFLRGQ